MLAANGVTTVIQENDGAAPTPVMESLSPAPVFERLDSVTFWVSGKTSASSGFCLARRCCAGSLAAAASLAAIAVRLALATLFSTSMLST